MCVWVPDSTAEDSTAELYLTVTATYPTDCGPFKVYIFQFYK